VQSVIKEALARGADRGLHLEDTAFDGLDAFGAAAAIAAAAQADGFELLLTGLQSDDHGYAQTGVIAAELLGLPHATIVMDLQTEGSGIKVKRELEAGFFQWVTMPVPAVFTIQSGINTLRYATLKGIMAAKKKEIKKLDAAALGLDAATLAPKQQIRRVYFPQKSKQTQMIEGTAAVAAATLVEKLKNEARVF
jgi:electron transfer flavoprotein beta subunit